MKADRTGKAVVMLAFRDAQILDITGPLQILAAANDERHKESPAYRLTLLAERKGAFATSSGLKLVADDKYAALPRTIDTLIVAGGEGVRTALRDEALLDTIKSGARRARRVCSVCTGAFLLAAAGLLKGKRATTHWRATKTLAGSFPDVTVEPDAIFVRDGRIWSSAGVTAGMDLALALLQEDYGAELALTIARRHVIYRMRPGGQSQFSAELSADANEGRLAQLLRWLPEHIADNLDISLLASRARMSERSFARAFLKETGETPARYVERTRLEAARRLLSSSLEPVAIVAAKAGFGTEERMRRTFQRHMKISPATFRARFNAREIKP
jgi:transcriptional regulator GlxA family with amidase domain